MIPKNAQKFANGQYYKIGALDFVYRWNGTEWIKSTVQKSDFCKMKGVERL